MAIPPCGTFDYRGVVPDRAQTSWQLEDTSGAGPTTGDPARDNRLVGLRPTLEIHLDGRVVLTASGPERAQVAAATLNLDAKTTRLLQPGDVVNLTRIATGELGVSVLRDDQLLFAAGLASAVPTDSAISVRVGSQPDLSALDIGSLEHADKWVDIAIGNATARLRDGEEAQLDGCTVSVLRCFEFGLPGKNESLAISRNGLFPHDAALRSAKQLDQHGAGVTTEDWRQEELGPSASVADAPPARQSRVRSDRC